MVKILWMMGVVMVLVLREREEIREPMRMMVFLRRSMSSYFYLRILVF